MKFEKSLVSTWYPMSKDQQNTACNESSIVVISLGCLSLLVRRPRWESSIQRIRGKVTTFIQTSLQFVGIITHGPPISVKEEVPAPAPAPAQGWILKQKWKLKFARCRFHLLEHSPLSTFRLISRPNAICISVTSGWYWCDADSPFPDAIRFLCWRFCLYLVYTQVLLMWYLNDTALIRKWYSREVSHDRCFVSLWRILVSDSAFVAWAPRVEHQYLVCFRRFAAGCSLCVAISRRPYVCPSQWVFLLQETSHWWFACFLRWCLMQFAVSVCASWNVSSSRGADTALSFHCSTFAVL